MGEISVTKTITVNIFISILITVILIFILSIVLSLTSISENIIMPMTIFISAISILIGSFNSSRKIKKKGILCGGCIGGIYIVILYIASSIMNGKFGLTVNSIIMVGCCVLGGILGGILGVNYK